MVDNLDNKSSTTSTSSLGKKKSTKWILIGGGVVGVGIVIWYRKQSSANAAANNTSTGVDPNAIDPATGLPYSQENIGAAIDPNTGVPYSQEYGSGINYPYTNVMTNASWAQNAESYLASLGYNPIDVAAALGLYLSGHPLTANQEQIVQAALAFEGAPPSPVPNPTVAPPTGQNPNNPNPVFGKVSINPPPIPKGNLIPHMPGKFRMPGGFNQAVPLRTAVQDLLGKTASPNEVEAFLRRLVAANPSLKNHTTALGGHAYVWPS